MLRYFTIFFLLATPLFLRAQHADTLLYHPMSDARADIAAAIKQAEKENKHVLIQAGGNWCKWCIEFNRFCKADKQIDSMIAANYVVYHLNYSKENKNESILASYGYPQRFGFPVFLILDGKGKLLHTENSSYLEEGKSYNKEKIMWFLKAWNVAALDPKTYEKK